MYNRERRRRRREKNNIAVDDTICTFLYIPLLSETEKKEMYLNICIDYSSPLNDNITVTLYSVGRGPEKKNKEYIFKKNKQPNECAFSLYK